MYIKHLVFAASALFLASCMQVSDIMSAQNADGLNPAPDGLHVTGSDLRIDFGRAEAGAIAAVSKILGAEPTSRVENAECGAGPITTVSFEEGLDLLFMNGNFAGWYSDSAGFVTSNGLAAGMTRTALEAKGVTEFFETSLGTEFSSGEVFGIFDGPDGDARVMLLWAGVSCFFR